MKSVHKQLPMLHYSYSLVLAATLALLLIPLLAMQLSDAVDWGLFDFVAMGVMCTVAGGLLVFASQKLSAGSRIATMTLVAAGFLYLWAELAVGLFFNLGS